MSTQPASVVLPTRRLDPATVELLQSLKPGDTIRIIQKVRIGHRKWNVRTRGTFRGLAYLNTGITTERVRDDDLVVPVLRYAKPSGELTSVAIDEQIVVEK